MSAAVGVSAAASAKGLEALVRNVLVALALAIALSPVVLGHHSFAAAYFEEQSVTIDGSISEFAYRSPHAWVYLDVTDATGRVTRYSAEWANPNRLKRDGVTMDTLRPGDRVIITGSPGRKADDNKIHLKRIARPADGWQWRGGRR
jgi:hypothetical protein